MRKAGQQQVSVVQFSTWKSATRCGHSNIFVEFISANVCRIKLNCNVCLRAPLAGFPERNHHPRTNGGHKSAEYLKYELHFNSRSRRVPNLCNTPCCLSFHLAGGKFLQIVLSKRRRKNRIIIIKKYLHANKSITVKCATTATANK